MFFFIVQYLQKELGFGPLQAGAAFVPMTFGVFVMSRFTPRLVARFGQALLITIGSVGLTVCFAWLSNVGESSGYTSAVLGPLLISGVSGGLIFMPTASLAMGGVEPEHAGSASGLLQTMQQLGGAIGLAVIVSVYAAGAVPGAVLPGMRAAMLTAAGFMVLALVVVAVLIRPRRAVSGR
jgi:MFS family permease